MSLAIDVDKVTSVLLGNEWYEVVDQSFTCDAYEFVWKADSKNPKDWQIFQGEVGGCLGFEFTVKGSKGKAIIGGPLSMIQAVSYDR